MTRRTPTLSGGRGRMAPMGWADRRLPPAPEALTWERVHGALNELDAGLGFVRSIPLDVALLGAMATYVE